jgi:hypothetical protein
MLFGYQAFDAVTTPVEAVEDVVEEIDQHATGSSLRPSTLSDHFGGFLSRA